MNFMFCPTDYRHPNTVTESSDFGFIPLLWLPQDPQGCLEKQNHSLISNLVLWCAKIGPKSHNFWKTSEMTRKTTKTDGFLTVFWSFWVLGPILAHQTAKFELSGQFCFSRHPWGPWGHQSSGVICIWKIYQLFCDSGAALVDFFKLMKMLPNVSFISRVIKKVFLSVSIATISNFLQKCTLLDKWHH